MQIAIISDTHMPRAHRRLPDECVARLRAADLIIHAGDLATLTVLRELQALGDVVAVHGNVDDGEVRHALPSRRQIEVAGVLIGIVHDAGPARGRTLRLQGFFPEAAAVVFGHSHIPMHERTPDGFQSFNPGSPTERRRSQRHTMGIAQVAKGRVSFDLIALD